MTMVKIITRETLAAEAKQRRNLDPAQDIPRRSFKEGFDLRTAFDIRRVGDRTVVEAIGSDALSRAFLERQRYEVDAGRDTVPLLYPAIYSEVIDASIPEVMTIDAAGPLGVVFEEIVEGEEVRFVSIQGSEKTVRQRHWGAAIQYTEQIWRFNLTFRLINLERAFGQAANALRDHIYLSPILNHTYTADQKTAASTLGTNLVEKYHNTIDAGITHSRQDDTWPRRGPYGILCSSANLSMIRKAVTEASQQGFQLQSPEVFSSIQWVMTYDGWTGTRGKKSTTYPGVTAGKAYLINLAYREMDFQSWVQQPLRQQQGEKDTSRFILEESIWDTWFGLYASPRAAVEELTLPTS